MVTNPFAVEHCADGNDLGNYDVALPPWTTFGSFTSLSTLVGQNTAPPSEKVFTQHFIIQAPPTTGGYYDPSYGVTYTGGCNFETNAVAAYAFPEAYTSSTQNFEVRSASGCNITFKMFSTN